MFVILFGVGKTDTEGVYSLRAVTGNEGLPVDTIIAFESSEDAERFALFHPVVYVIASKLLFSIVQLFNCPPVCHQLGASGSTPGV